jgi:hypothetical protein
MGPRTAKIDHASDDIPTTPLTSDDDEWPGLSPSPNTSPQHQCRKAAAQRVQIHPLVIGKSPVTMQPNASSATVLELTLADLEAGGWTRTRCRGTCMNLVKLYRSLHRAHPLAPARTPADSLFPTPPSRCSSSKAPCSHMSRPLPALPGPHPQLDSTFPRRCQALPPPIPCTTTTMTPSVVRKSHKITLPHVLLRTLLPLDVADIFDDVDNACPEQALR